MKIIDKLYYILSFTWGILANILGAIVYGVIVASSKFIKSEKKIQYGRVVLIFGNNWGGLSLGNFVFLSKASSKDTSTLSHEIGHSIQNILWGPLFLFVIGIPSALRYWYRETDTYKNNPEKHTDYDSIWFEGQATKWGTSYLTFKDSVKENT